MKPFRAVTRFLGVADARLFNGCLAIPSAWDFTPPQNRQGWSAQAKSQPSKVHLT
jgi:hypothetical protein